MKLKKILNEIGVEQMKVYPNPYATAFKPIKEDETKDPQEITVGNYQTRHYDMCPGATTVYKDIEDKGVDMDLAERTARIQDVLFYLEKHTVKEMESATEEDVLMAKNLQHQIMAMAKMMGLEKEHGYIQGHIDAIEKVASEETNEESLNEGEFVLVYKGSKVDGFVAQEFKAKDKESALKQFISWYNIPKKEWDDIKISKNPNILQKLFGRFK